ncbi:hypothetical protein G6F66_012504 [Rhizopus arrhizus]|nr:hypothetical protein G6F66_012504 [Rhizopus arrhizus]
MSSSKPTISQEQIIFEIEERVYRLLAPEFRTKYLAYRKVSTYPEDQRINYGRKTAEYFESIANKFASDFILNNNRQLNLEEDINLEEAPMSYNNSTNINMENLAQLIASAISSAIPKNTENTNSHIRIPIPSTYGGERNAATINIWIQEVERYLQFYDVPNIEYAFKPSYSQQAARDRLANIKQSSSVIEYVDVFQDILLDLPNISDDESLDRFVRGLKDNVRIHVLTKEPRTLEEASKFAIAFESAQQIGMMPVKIQQDRYVNDPMDLSVLLHQLNAMVASNKDNNNFQHNRQNNGYARRSTIICHWCNKPGHTVLLLTA